MLNAQHWHAPAVVHEAVPVRHALQDAGHPLPPDDDDADDPLLELAELPPVHAPSLHVWLVCVQSVQLPPPVPHAVSSIWQVPVPSQQPLGQLVPSQVVPPLESSPLPDELLLALLP